LFIAVSALIGFTITYWITPKSIRFFKGIGVCGVDQQKKGKPLIVGAGGIPVFFGFFFAVMSFIGLVSFLDGNSINLSFVLAALITAQTIMFVGFMDDLNIRSEKKKDTSGTLEFRVGLPQWKKAILVLPAAVPLMAVMAGSSVLTIPFLGAIDFGIFFPLFFIPLGVLCVANATNMLAGQNGLEAGMGAVALLALGVFSFLIRFDSSGALIPGRIEATVIAFAAAFVLIAFLRFNWTPAKILPGDSLTYFIGGVYASVTVIGNIERFAIILFLPWIIEAFLKASQKFKATSLGALQEDGSLKPPNGRVESLNHFVMKLGDFSERQIVLIFVFVEVMISLIAFGLFFTRII